MNKTKKENKKLLPQGMQLIFLPGLLSLLRSGENYLTTIKHSVNFCGLKFLLITSGSSFFVSTEFSLSILYSMAAFSSLP